MTDSARAAHHHFWVRACAYSRQLPAELPNGREQLVPEARLGAPAAHTSSRMGDGFDKLFFAREDSVLPSSAESPSGSLPCTVLQRYE